MGVSTVKRVIKEPSLILRWILYKFFKWLPDEPYLKIEYFIRMKKRLNLKNPQTFNEKLQWLKLYDRNPMYTQMADKATAKEYVASIIGEDYIIPTLGAWEKFDDINFDKLPNQFVLKTTHDSGGVVICRDKAGFDVKKARRKLNSRLKENFYYKSREWVYKNVHPRIIAEKFLVDVTDEMIDYKFLCFYGEPKIMYICGGHEGYELSLSYMSMEWEEISIPRKDTKPFKSVIEKPLLFDKMKDVSRTLSKNIPFIRVDWFEENEKMWFNELTLFPTNGMVPFANKEDDVMIGKWIDLPKISTER